MDCGVGSSCQRGVNRKCDTSLVVALTQANVNTKPKRLAQAKVVLMVPGRGLEPPHPKAHGPEPCASTNSAIRAIFGFHHFESQARWIIY